MYRQNNKQRKACERNWGLYILKCVRGNLKLFKRLLPPVEYARLENSVEWSIMELERSYWK